EAARELEPARVASDAGDENARGARLLGGERAGKPLLSRPLDQHVVAHFHAAVAERPLVAVRHHRADEHRRLCRKLVADFRRERVGGEINIGGEAAEEVRRGRRAGAAAVARPLLAEAVRAAAAVGAAAAAARAFQDNAVAFFEAVNVRRFAAELYDAAQ